MKLTLMTETRLCRDELYEAAARRAKGHSPRPALSKLLRAKSAKPLSHTVSIELGWLLQTASSVEEMGKGKQHNER